VDTLAETAAEVKRRAAQDPEAAYRAAGYTNPLKRDGHERTGDAVSHEDAREAIANVSAFFTLLAAWDRASEPASPKVAELRPEHEARPDAGPREANAL